LVGSVATVAVYSITADPPFDDGTSQEMSALPLPEDEALTPVGAVGFIAAITNSGSLRN
jgi:hypothetical protein